MVESAVQTESEVADLGTSVSGAFSLYSPDGKREVEVRAFLNGTIYVVERELVEGTTFKDRHHGVMVGPFASSEEAERAIVATEWFSGPDQ